MVAYYNENNPKKAAWLRELINEGVIAPGDVDERSIKEVNPEDVRHYTQCHWFAGIGVWSYALRLAGWEDTRPVWTGSCPCQSFSRAGKQEGISDPRHLWPDWFKLIRECQPPVIFGEQVEAAIRKGWLDLVQDDLEAEDYAVGKIVLPACSIGAPHLRQRIWFSAVSTLDNSGGTTCKRNTRGFLEEERRIERKEQSKNGDRLIRYSDASDVRGCAISDSSSEGLQGLGLQRFGSARERTLGQGRMERGYWGDVEYLPFKDGKQRITKSSPIKVANDTTGGVRQVCDCVLSESEKKIIYPLVNKSQDSSKQELCEIDFDNTSEARAMRIEGYGDAIVAELAAEFIATNMDYLSII